MGERGGAVIHRDAAHARLSGRGDRLSSSVLISAFNTLNNRACGACRAPRFGAVRVARRSYRPNAAQTASCDAGEVAFFTCD